MCNEEFMDELKAVMAMTEEEQNKYFEAMEPDGTSTLLVDDLEALPQTEERDAIVQRAKAFGYDDFKFTMMYGHEDIVCPKMKLVEDLTRAVHMTGDLKYLEIINAVKNGKYD